MPLTDKEITALQKRLEIVEERLKREIKEGDPNELRNFRSALGNQFAEGDKNKNRMPDPGEISAAFLLKAVDKNENGQVEREELKKGLLRLADQNKDGTLSKYEAIMFAMGMEKEELTRLNTLLGGLQKKDKNTKVNFDVARVELLEEALGIAPPRETPSESKPTVRQK